MRTMTLQGFFFPHVRKHVRIRNEANLQSRPSEMEDRREKEAGKVAGIVQYGHRHGKLEALAMDYRWTGCGRSQGQGADLGYWT